MSRFRLLLLFFIAFAAPSFAQWSAYGTVALTNYGYQTNSSFSNQNLSFKGDTASLLVGGFYNFPIDSRVTVGVDARGDFSGSKGGEYFAADLRVAFVPKGNRLRPFFGLGGGVVTTSHVASVFNTATRNTGGGLELDLGLDVRLTGRVDLRAFDLGSVAGGSAGAATLATGLVYHFSPARQ